MVAWLLFGDSGNKGGEIKVIAPNSEKAFVTDQKIQVAWESKGNVDDQISVLLYDSDGFTRHIARKTPNDGHHVLALPDQY